MIAARIIFFSLMALIGLILLGSFIFFYYIAGRNGRALKYTSETAPRSMRDYIRQTEEAEEEIRHCLPCLRTCAGMSHARRACSHG